MTHDNKAVIVTSMLSLRDAYGGVLPGSVLKSITDQWGISPRTLRWWVQQADAQPAAPTDDETGQQAEAAHQTPGRDAFELTEEHLVVVRSTLNVKAAHALLFPESKKGRAGWVSYRTFARAFKNLPPSIRDGILNGWEGMAKRQVYLSAVAPHRNHTWHLDHTQADVWVSLPGGNIIRPWVSVVRDNATSMRLAAVAYLGRPNEDSICDLLATAAMQRRYKTDDGPVVVGGMPVQLVLDNGREHFAEAVTRGALFLGVVVNPTKAYYKHLNGPAESTFSGLNKQLLKGLPGYTKGGDGDDGQPLVAARYADQVDPADVLTFESFQLHLDRWLVGQNTTQRMKRLGNRTPLQAWVSDPTSMRDTPEETVRAMMQRASSGRVVNAEGICFRNINYIAPELGYYRERGLRLDVRYLKRETRFIDVFDGDTWVCRAIDRNLLTEAQRRAILLGRERDLNLLKEINAEANQERAHRAQTDDSDVYDDEPTDVNDAAAKTATEAATEAVEEAVDNVSDLTQARARRAPASGTQDAAADPATSRAGEMDRVDPTTPQRRKRQPARSRKTQAQARREAKDNESRERITRRPGANFGEDE